MSDKYLKILIAVCGIFAVSCATKCDASIPTSSDKLTIVWTSTTSIFISATYRNRTVLPVFSGISIPVYSYTSIFTRSEPGDDDRRYLMRSEWIVLADLVH